MTDLIRRYDKQIISFLVGSAMILGGWAWNAEARLQRIATAVELEKDHTHEYLQRIEALVRDNKEGINEINRFLRDGG